MMLMSIGFSTGGEPSAHWPFTSLLIAKPATALYRAWPALPWYALYLHTAHFVASCILVFVALRRLGAFPRSSLFVCLAALVSLELLILTRVQFTSVGFVMAAAADLPDLDMLGLGSLTHSPPFNARLEARGIEHLPSAVFQRDDVFLLANPDHHPTLIDYVRDHYDLEGWIEPLDPEWRWQTQVVRGRLRESP